MTSAARQSPTPPSISAVIPCHNGAPYVRQAVLSAMTQTRPVDEVIVIDDGSTDDSAAIVEGLGARCVRMPRRSGPGAARNRGIAEARGEFIAFLDADDYWGPTHCEHVAALLERHSACAVAFSRMRRFGADEDSLTPIVFPADQPTAVVWHLLRGNFVPQSTAIARRSTLEEHGGYDTTRTRAEDYDLWLRLAQSHPFVCVHTVTANYRLHAGQLTRDIEGMVQGYLQAKHQFWRSATLRETGDFAQRVAAELLSGWNATLDDAWARRNERAFRTALDLHGLVPGSAAAHRRWTRQYGVWWRSWFALSRAWDRLPRATRNLARPMLRALFAPRRTGPA